MGKLEHNQNSEEVESHVLHEAAEGAGDSHVCYFLLICPTSHFMCKARSSSSEYSDYNVMQVLGVFSIMGMNLPTCLKEVWEDLPVQMSFELSLGR